MILVTCPDHDEPLAVDFEDEENARDWAALHEAVCGGHRIKIVSLDTAQEVR